eukprot:9151791-Pyramimonas_sp.AAC.1
MCVRDDGGMSSLGRQVRESRFQRKLPFSFEPTRSKKQGRGHDRGGPRGHAVAASGQGRRVVVMVMVMVPGG